MNRTAWIVTLVIVVVAPALGLHAQWLRYPTVGVPRLPDGQPNLSAPAPKTAAGTPDLSGVWLANPETGTGVSFAGAPLPPLFRDIGARLIDTDLLEFICLENQKFQPLPARK